MHGWNLEMIRRVRQMRRNGSSLRFIAAGFPKRPFSEVQEAWWATMRNGEGQAALDYLEQVLTYQDERIQLVNGKPLIFGRKHG